MWGGLVIARNGVTGTCLILIILLAATSLARNSLWKEEVALWNDSAGKSSIDGRPYTNMAAELNRQGRYEEALEAYGKALERNPENHFALNGRAFALFQLKRFSDAVSEYRNAIKAFDLPLYHENLALALEKSGAVREAVEEVTGIIRDSPDNISQRAYLLTILYSMGEREKFLLTVIRKYSRSVDPSELLDAGWACIALEHNEAAAAHLQKALGLAPHINAAHYYLGIALGRLERPEEAVGHLEKAMREPQIYRTAESHYNLGIVYQMLGEASKAGSEYLLALERDPNHSQAHNNLGVVYLSLGKKADALGEFQAAVKADPKNAEARKNLESVKGLTLTTSHGAAPRQWEPGLFYRGRGG